MMVRNGIELNNIELHVGLYFRILGRWSRLMQTGTENLEIRVRLSKDQGVRAAVVHVWQSQHSDRKKNTTTINACMAGINLWL